MKPGQRNIREKSSSNKVAEFKRKILQDAENSASTIIKGAMPSAA